MYEGEPMDNPIFRDMAEKMKRAGESMVEAHSHLVAANGQFVVAMHAYGESLDAMIAAHEEHEDLRVTVARLEGLVLELVERGRKNGEG